MRKSRKHIWKRRPSRSRPALVAALALSLMVGGCRSVYLARLAVEQTKYLARAEPVEDLIEASTDDETRVRLRLVLEAREFAIRSGLEAGGSYLKVTDTEAAATFQVVTAAYADKLLPYTWWYPVVGAIPYRGYFDRESAERFAARLDPQAFDVRIVEASAYSTLGWFDDPLPSSLLDQGRASLVTTVLHELVHTTYFLPGEIAFNETLATSLGLRLGISFFEEHGDTARASRIREHHAKWLERSDFFDALAARLGEFFAAWPDDEAADDADSETGSDGMAVGERLTTLLAEKDAIYLDAQERFRAAGLAYGESDAFLNAALNNATFLAIYRYAKRAKAVDRVVAQYASAGEVLGSLESRLKNDGDLVRLLDSFAQPPSEGATPTGSVSAQGG